MSYSILSYCLKCTNTSIQTKDKSEIDTVLQPNESQSNLSMDQISDIKPVEFIFIKSKTKQPRSVNQLCQRIRTYKSENKY